MTTQPPDSPRFAALNALPPDYQMTARLTLKSVRTVIMLNLAGLVLFVVGALTFLGVCQLLESLGTLAQPDLRLDERLDAVLFLVLLVALIVIHELCHGIAFRAFGARIRYGVNLKMGVAYAAAPDYYLTRNAYLIVGLAPLVVISIGAVIVMALTTGNARFMAGLFGAINVGSAIGDVWFIAVCLRYPPTMLVRDFGDGAEIYTIRQSDS